MNDVLAAIGSLGEELRKANERIERQAEAIRQLREALDELMEWQVKNVKKWHNPAYDNAHKALAATEDVCANS